jgi:hypothetical protein
MLVQFGYYTYDLEKFIARHCSKNCIYDWNISHQDVKATLCTRVKTPFGNREGVSPHDTEVKGFAHGTSRATPLSMGSSSSYHQDLGYLNHLG